MSIRSINPYGPQRPTPAAGSAPVQGAADVTPAARTRGTAGAGAPADHTRAARADSVSISDAGRALAGGEARPALTPERVAELRKKVLEGAYNSTHAADAVARHLLSAGDV